LPGRETVHLGIQVGFKRSLAGHGFNETALSSITSLTGLTLYDLLIRLLHLLYLSSLLKDLLGSTETNPSTQSRVKQMDIEMTVNTRDSRERLKTKQNQFRNHDSIPKNA
jgi:hypothetical protein